MVRVQERFSGARVRILTIPVIDRIAIGEGGVNRRRKGIGRQSVLHHEGRLNALRRIVELVLADEAGKVSATLDRGDAREGAGEGRADGGLAVGRIGQAEARAEAAVPAGHQAARVLATGSKTGEPERAEASIRARVWPGGIEVGVFVLGVDGRKRKVVAQPDVEHQLAGDAPVILCIEAKVAVFLRCVADGFRTAQIRLAE